MIEVAMSKKYGNRNELMLENGGGDKICFVSRVDDKTMIAVWISQEITVGGQLADSERNNFHWNLL